MPITYTATDSRGRVHTRTSAAERVYTHAIVRLYADGKSAVSFAGSRRLAEARLGEYNADAVEIVEAVVVPPKGRRLAAPTPADRIEPHARDCAYVTTGGPATCTCGAAERYFLGAQPSRKPAKPRPPRVPAIPAACPTGRTYSGLTQAYDYFNRELFGGELPSCLVTLQRKAKTFGYFAADRFGTRDKSETTDEIALNPSHFAGRSTREVLSTLAHEMAHLKRQREGKPPRGGYHDKPWAAVMREVGLIPSNTGQPGGKETGQKVSHYIEQGGRFDRACARLEAEGFDLAYVELWDDQKAERAKRAAASKTKYTCPSCDANAWAKPEAKLVCGECDERMEG